MGKSHNILFAYLLALVLVLVGNSIYAQINVVHYNAGWNDVNSVKWIEDLSDCDISKVDIVDNPKLQSKHKIVVVPTILIFVDGEEVKRYQADISFAIKEEQSDIQDVIDEILMSDF